jgi:hypothetical protein
MAMFTLLLCCLFFILPFHLWLFIIVWIGTGVSGATECGAINTAINTASYITHIAYTTYIILIIKLNPTITTTTTTTTTTTPTHSHPLTNLTSITPLLHF